MSSSAPGMETPSGPVATAVAAERARRQAVLGAAVEAMRPLIETLTALKSEGLTVALSLRPPSSRGSDLVEGSLRCLAIHGDASAEPFDYDLVVRVDGSVTVSTPVARDCPRGLAYWACEYSSANGGPAFLARLIDEAAVKDAMERLPEGDAYTFA